MTQSFSRSSRMMQVLGLVLLAAVFLRAVGASVPNLDSWADWKYGQWIWEHKALPGQDPFANEVAGQDDLSEKGIAS